MGDRNGNTFPNLATQIKYMDLLPIANLIPTPKASDGIKGKGGPNGYVKTLGKAIEGTNGASTGMKLQPAFVEFMMGFPEGWTEIRDSKPSEMP